MIVLDHIGSTILGYAMFLAAVGTIVMALQEVLKSILRWRLSFNRGEFDRWLRNDEPLRKEFMLLTTGGYEREETLFDQPVEKMLGQIQAAANMALDFPAEYPRLYRFLTQIPGAPEAGKDGEKWASFAMLKPKEMAERSKDEQNEAAKARARLGNLVARKLDAFQNETQYSWARANQRIAVSASAALIVIVLLLSGFTDGKPANWLMLPLLAIGGGTVAPFAKDVVSGLAQFGKGK